MIPRSSEIRVELTNVCHYNCAICVNHRQTRPRSFMTFDFFKTAMDKILAECDWFKTVSFAGMGSPLLNKHVFDAVAYVSACGLAPIIVTNADMLTRDTFIRLKDAGIRSVRVSFHGIDPEGYARLHGVSPEKFHKIRAQLEEIFAIKGDVRILMALVIMKGINEGRIEDWIAMWEGKADLLEIWSAHNWIDQLPNRALQVERMPTCGRIEHGPLQLQVDGSITACCFDWDNSLVYGNICRNTLAEIFESDAYRKVLLAHRSGEYNGLVCRHCDQRNVDKTEALIYSSCFKDAEERVKMTSTCYEKVIP